MDEILTGKVVMVNPDLRDTLIYRKGEIAVIAAADLDGVTMKFENNQYAKYDHDIVLVFKSPKEIHDHLEKAAVTMPENLFYNLRNVVLLLSYGSQKQERTAMEIVSRNPVLISSALRPLDVKLRIDYSQENENRYPKLRIMENEKLAGSLVLVHPQTENDPNQKQGQVGILTYAHSADENYVSFPKGGESIYPATNLMLLKNKEDILDVVMHHSSTLSTDDFKAMYKIMLLQDRGTSTDRYQALEIARDHPGIWDKSLQPLTRSERVEVEKTIAR